MTQHTHCYFDGKIIEKKKAHLPVDDLGVLRGYSVFDFVFTYNGAPFLLKEHWMRTKRSAKELHLTLPLSFDAYEKIVHKLLKKNNCMEGSFAVRTVVTGGTSNNCFAPDGKSTFYVFTHDLSLPHKKLYTSGGALVTHDFQRALPHIKTTNYIEAIKNLAHQRKNKAVETLYIHKNKALECTTSNLFIIKNNTLITPEKNILKGITRNHVLKIAKKSGITIREKDITLKVLFAADEAFITGSAKHVLPITKIDKKHIGNGAVGPLTKALTDLYELSYTS